MLVSELLDEIWASSIIISEIIYSDCFKDCLTLLLCIGDVLMRWVPGKITQIRIASFLSSELLITSFLNTQNISDWKQKSAGFSWFFTLKIILSRRIDVPFYYVWATTGLCGIQLFSFDQRDVPRELYILTLVWRTSQIFFILMLTFIPTVHNYVGVFPST